MKEKALFIVSTFIYALIAPYQYCSGQEGSGDSSVITHFGKRLSSDIKKDDVHGSISGAIIKNGKVIWAGAFGYVIRDKDIAADTSTIYRIGSITKTFTATILMQLVEERKVKLDDSVEKYLPEIKSLKGYSDKTIITFRQLASHTSGLRREPGMPGASLGPVDQWESKLLSSIPYTSFKSSPGTHYQYSNIGYALLGLALERVSGVPYIQMVQQRIFTPLHMYNTFFSVPENKMAELAEGFVNLKKKVKDKINKNPSLQRVLDNPLGGYTVPCGGIYSTPLDLAKFVIALMGKTLLLQPESLSAMQIIPPGGRYYGLGLMLARYGKLDFIGHGGLVQGYISQFSIEQHNVYAGILMRNYNRGRTNLGLGSRRLLSKLSKGSI
ncbi:MAG TPA: serine hydrolase domain-containing protein [Puia sp.]|nr:serine hydrolase domain-containing protein [Puia sp.]